MTEDDTGPPDVLTAAHGYVRRGWGVLPLYGVAEDGACRCPDGDLCPPKNRGKHPHGTRTGWRVFTSGGDVQAWFDEHPEDNLGVTTGLESGIFVFDVDGPAGIASVGALAAEHGALPLTRIVRTGSGGLHYFFRHPGNFVVRNSTSYLAPGIDIRGKGGQVVAPPSVSGLGPYELLADADVVDAPGWLLGMLAEHSARVEHGHRAEVRTAEPVEAELVPERIATLRRTIVGDGGRHAHFYSLVAACREAGYTQGQTVTLVAPWCVAVDKFVGRIEQETARTWGKLETAAAQADEWVPGLGSPTAVPLTRDYVVPPPEALRVLPTGAVLAPPSYAPVAVALDPEGLAPPLDLPPTWAPVDLGPILDGTYVPEVAELFPRVDGPCLVYRGRVHSFHGESESGKSLICQGEGARILRAGGHVAYLDFESDAGAVTARMLELGAPADAIRSRFTYRRPDADPTQFPAEREAYGELLRTEGLDLVVIDGLTDALAVFGASSNDMDEVTGFLRRFPRLVARRTGAAVILVDHVTKDANSRGRHAVGSQAKLNGLDGAAYVVEVVEAIGRGMVGTIVLRAAKDRPGGVRPVSGTFRKGDRTQEAARITVDSSGDPVDGIAIRMTVAPPLESGDIGTDGAGGQFRPTNLMERVSRTLEDAEGSLSLRQVRTSTTGNGSAIDKALKVLVDEDFAGLERDGKNDRYVSARPYRSEEDSASGDYLGWVSGGVPAAGVSNRVLTVSSAERTRVSPSPSPLRGGDTLATGEDTPTVPSGVSTLNPNLLVGCKSCFRPTPEPEAAAFGGRCRKCGQLAGLVPDGVEA